MCTDCLGSIGHFDRARCSFRPDIKVDEDGRVVALFHVQFHEKSKTVTIDEIEVLDLLSRNESWSQ